MRRCNNCQVTKPLDDFYNDKNKPLGKEYRCKVCAKIKRDKNLLMSNYGLTTEDYSKMLKSQDSRCAICSRTDTGIERTKKLSVDHDHQTGEIRGLLCNWCNQGLGHFRDSPELLNKAVQYLLKK